MQGPRAITGFAVWLPVLAVVCGLGGCQAERALNEWKEHAAKIIEADLQKPPAEIEVEWSPGVYWIIDKPRRVTGELRSFDTDALVYEVEVVNMGMTYPFTSYYESVEWRGEAMYWPQPRGEWRLTRDQSTDSVASR
ncbi:MAG: hypothetical protein AAF823_00745 [Planctomycetota bacterium]